MAQMGGKKLANFLDWILVYGPLKRIHGHLRFTDPGLRPSTLHQFSLQF